MKNIILICLGIFGTFPPQLLASDATPICPDTVIGHSLLAPEVTLGLRENERITADIQLTERTDGEELLIGTSQRVVGVRLANISEISYDGIPANLGINRVVTTANGNAFAAFELDGQLWTFDRSYPLSTQGITIPMQWDNGGQLTRGRFNPIDIGLHPSQPQFLITGGTGVGEETPLFELINGSIVRIPLFDGLESPRALSGIYLNDDGQQALVSLAAEAQPFSTIVRLSSLGTMRQANLVFKARYSTPHMGAPQLTVSLYDPIFASSSFARNLNGLWLHNLEIFSLEETTGEFMQIGERDRIPFGRALQAFITRMQAPPSHQRPYQSPFRFLPRKRILVGTLSGSVNLISLAPDLTRNEDKQFLNGHDESPVTVVTSSPDNQTFAFGSQNGDISVWFDEGDGPNIRIRGIDSPIVELFISREGQLLVAARPNRTDQERRAGLPPPTFFYQIDLAALRKERNSEG